MSATNPEQGQLAWVTDLFKIGARLSRDDLGLVQRQILEHTVNGFKATSGTLALTLDGEAGLVIVAGIALPPHVIGQVIRFGEGVMGTVAMSTDPVLINGDISQDQRFAHLARPRETRPPSSAICWPLHIDGRVIGVMSINRRAEEPPFVDQDLEIGATIVNLMTLVIENAQLQTHQREQIQELHRLNTSLNDLNSRLEDAHSQLLQSEKMASIGQLAAGVAHEINNPVGYINSNLGTLHGYIRDLFDVMACYVQAERLLPADSEVLAEIRRVREKVDLDYLKQDITDLLSESEEGVSRVRKIVRDLKEFSHVDSTDWQWADLHKGLASTLNIVHNEVKYKAEVITEYGDIPLVECIASQVNQVFMNILVNAAQAMDERGTITIRTGTEGNCVWVDISDTGKGIAPEILRRIFDPFFTTKPVGQGTGLGLSLSWGIAQRHGGRLEAASTVGAGTRFRLTLPVSRQVSGVGFGEGI